MSLTTYPLNNTNYTAEDAELFHVTRTSGIFSGGDFGYKATGADNNITISTGIGWIKNGDFAGKVIALKQDTTLDLGLPDSVYPRIDAIVLQFSTLNNLTDLIVKKGAAASTPTAPEVERTGSVYELHLYRVYRSAGASVVKDSDITDVRLDQNCCGLMADSITSVDTAAISKQVNALIEDLRAEIKSVEDGSAYAPAGYGLGTGATRVADANEATLNGWYYGDEETLNMPVTYGLLFVQKRTSNGIFQRASNIQNGMEYTRYYNGSTWSDWKKVLNEIMFSYDDGVLTITI